nr:hypothetical protein [Desulfobulbaceae bacterium]
MKKQYILTPFIAACFMLSLSPLASLAGDLDDGISKYTDDSVEATDKLGDPDKNIKYIITKAKSQAAAGESGAEGGGNMNSVVVGPGTNIRGDVIILDQSKGDKTQVVQ